MFFCSMAFLLLEYPVNGFNKFVVSEGSLQIRKGTGKKLAHTEQLNVLGEDGDTPNITTTVTALQTALGAGDKTSYDAALVSLKTYSDSLKSKYQAIAAVEAPKDLEDKRLALKGHADNLCTMLDDSIELYTIAGEALSKDLTEEQISRINILQTEIGQLQGSADSFDSILNEIMAAE